MILRNTVFRPCPLCASEDVETLHRQDFATPRELLAPPSYDVVKCEKCGFVYANQRVSQASLDKVYESHSKYATNVTIDPQAEASASPPIDPRWDLDRLAGVAGYLAERIPDKSLRILDAGCSNGSFLSFLRDRGFTSLLGLDPSRSAVANAIAHNHVEAITGSFISPPDDIGTFDVVALSHVLEHLTDVQDAIKSLHRLLRPGGLAYIEVPDAARFDEFLVAPYHDFNTEHINHFSLPLLEALMASNAFESVDAGQKTVYCSPIDLYPAIYGLWRKVDGVPAPSMPHGTEADSTLVTATRRYIDQSARLMEHIDAKLAADLAGEETVIIWGVGQLTMKLLRDTILAKKDIAAVVDTSPQRQGMHIDEMTIQAPPVLRDLPPYPIVVGSLHHESSIIDMIRERLRLTNPVIRLYRP